MVTAAASSTPSPRGRPARRRGVPPAASRDRLLAAAAAEFAARGFAGANIDRIARGARLNKAMIYYHFRSKAALYSAILQDMFAATGAAVRAVADADLPPHAQIEAFIEAIAREARARPHFPPIWLRELAEAGRHVDAPTLREARGILEALAAILAGGRVAGVFRSVNPLLIHLGIVGPLVVYFSSAQVRRKIASARTAPAMPGPEDLLAHVRESTLAMLGTTADRTLRQQRRASAGRAGSRRGRRS